MELELFLTNAIYIMLVIFLLSLIILVVKIFPILNEIRILFEDVNKKSASLNPIFETISNVGTTLTKAGEAVGSGLERLISFFDRKEK